MPETVDALVLSARFDDTELARGIQQVVTEDISDGAGSLLVLGWKAGLVRQTDVWQPKNNPV